MNILTKEYVTEMDFIEQMISNVTNMNCIALNNAHQIIPGELNVDVINSTNASRVIEELTWLVKASKFGGVLYSKISVRRAGSSLVKMKVSYNKKVLFLNAKEERLTKDIATYLISNWK